MPELALTLGKAVGEMCRPLTGDAGVIMHPPEAGWLQG